MSPHKSKNKQGFSLITTILTIALVTSIAIGFSNSVLNRTTRVKSQSATIQSQLDAQAGLEFAIGQLLERMTLPSTSPDRFAVNGAPMYCILDERSKLIITIQDIAGLIDINATPIALLEKLIESTGNSDAFKVSRAIDEYRSQNLLHFVEELHLIPSMTKKLFDAIRPYITVYNGSSRLSPESVNSYIFDLISQFSTTENYLDAEPTNRLYSIEVIAQNLDASHKIQSVVELRPGRENLFRVLNWHGYVVPTYEFDSENKPLTDCLN